MQHVLHEIEIVLRERSAHIIISSALVYSACNKLLVLRHDYIEAALAVGRGTCIVVDFLPSVQRKNAVRHLAVDILYLLVVKQHTVCCDSKPEILAVLLLDTSRIIHGSLYGFPCHKRFAAEEVKFKVLASHRLLYQKIYCFSAGFRRHYLSSRAEIAGRSKAVFAAEIAVVRNVQAHCLYRRFNGDIRVFAVLVLTEQDLVFVQLIYLCIALAHIFFGELFQISDKALRHLLGKRGLETAHHFIYKLIDDMHAAAVHINYNIVLALFESVYRIGHNLSARRRSFSRTDKKGSLRRP